MQRKRYLLRWLTVPLIIAGMGWQFTKSPSASTPLPTSVKMLPLGVPYQVSIGAKQASLDLPFDAETEYDLIISSLGDAEKSFEVSLTSQNVQQVSSLPVRQLEVLQPPTHQPKLLISNVKPYRQITNIKSVSKKRTFRLHVTNGSLNDPAQYIPVPSRLVGEGQQVRVYLDQQIRLRELVTGLVGEIVRLFDHQIVPGFQKQMGSVRDVDGDGKFTILLTPWLGKLRGGKTSLDGFVRGSDFDPNVKLPFGQQCDMMYLNTHLKPGDHLQSLLAHEFTHALLFSHRLKQVGSKTKLQYEEDWLNEAMAHVGENLHGSGWSNLDYRICRFLEAPQNYPLVVSDYYRSGMWRNHGCRGATYLFLRWVVDQYGVEVLPQLIQSPVNGVRNIERVTNSSFAKLFRRWNVSMLMSHQEKRHQPSQKQAVDLWGALGQWNLAGVATIPWDIHREKTKKVFIKGTSTAFIRLQGTGDKQYQQISIQAKSGTRLQVTLIRRRAKKNALRISSKLIRVAETISSNVLQTEINYDTVNCHIQTVSIEINEGDSKESVCFEKDDLQRIKSKTNHSQSFERYTVPLPRRLQKQNANLLMKVVIEDRFGDRIARRYVIHRK